MDEAVGGPGSEDAPYALVIFDFDGTLADSARWFAGVINEVARRYRFREVAPGELEAMRGHDMTTLLEHLGVSRWKLPFVARHMRKLAARDIDQIPLFPGVDAMLRALHEGGLRLAVVSSNARENVETVLGPGLSRLIAHYACGASLFGKAKHIRRVLRDCAIAPARVIAIGDEFRDLDAAASVGIASGAVAWGYADATALAARRPAVMFSRMGEIAPKLLAKTAAAPA